MAPRIWLFLFLAPLKPDLVRWQLYSVLEGGRKYTKIGLAMGVKIGGDAAESGKETHLLVMMHVRLLQKIGILDLGNGNQFKKGNGYKQRMKSLRDYFLQN